jgi:hypothetical protein
MFTKIRFVTALIFTSVAAFLSVSFGAAGPASAQMRICTSTVCIGPVNGCSIALRGGGVMYFDDGDSFTSASGQTWTCTHGKWVVTSAPPASSVLSPSSGQNLPKP